MNAEEERGFTICNSNFNRVSESFYTSICGAKYSPNIKNKEIFQSNPFFRVPKMIKDHPVYKKMVAGGIYFPLLIATTQLHSEYIGLLQKEITVDMVNKIVLTPTVNLIAKANKRLPLRASMTNIETPNLLDELPNIVHHLTSIEITPVFEIAIENSKVDNQSNISLNSLKLDMHQFDSKLKENQYNHFLTMVNKGMEDAQEALRVEMDYFYSLTKHDKKNIQLNREQKDYSLIVQAFIEPIRWTYSILSEIQKESDILKNISFLGYNQLKDSIESKNIRVESETLCNQLPFCRFFGKIVENENEEILIYVQLETEKSDLLKNRNM
ncbi:hypothetical protein ABD87_22835 [Lysinibacillus sphaericus]|uniref:hypothetical protein n=1 Tax=Lysinibacillus sphaericus TaxID=1421 RepID=UPI0018CD9745|nr:hypothetical protein [Lysinibacillus sphaericus]MBG9732264.1 hypothetical protein [Lysinibacillus sphaericus]